VPQLEVSAGRADEGAVCRALARAGYAVDGTAPRPEFRQWRWLAPLPEGRIAFFADDPEAAERLSRERALLDLLGRRISGFAVPAVEHASPDGRLQVRRMVEGDTSLGGKAREPVLAASPAGRRFAGELGRALAELHGSVTPAEAEALGVPARGLFHQTAADLRQHLSGRLPEQPALEPVLDAVLEGYAALDGEDGERMLTHGDMGLHNIAIDPVAGRLVGMFDFEEAALDDRHADFYGLHSFGDAFTELALDAYATASGVRPSVRRAALHHLLGAFEALAGTLATGDPDWVARRLRWVRGAVAGTPGRLLGLPAARSGAMSCARMQISN
jgi:aminoglycoside phosphotransferase (APT) family kinase protein